MSLQKDLEDLTKELNSELKEMRGKDTKSAIKYGLFQKAVYLEEKADCLEYVIGRMEMLLDQNLVSE